MRKTSGALFLMFPSELAEKDQATLNYYFYQETDLKQDDVFSSVRAGR